MLKIVKKVYEYYEDIEFLKLVDFNDLRRYIKLIVVFDEYVLEVFFNFL